MKKKFVFFLMLIVTFEPCRIQKLVQIKSFRSVHLKATVQKLEQIIGNIGIGQRKLSTYNLRFGPEGVLAEYGKVESDTNGPSGSRLGLVISGQNPLGGHALQSALELFEGLVAASKVGRRAKINYFYRVVLEIDKNILWLNVSVHNAFGKNGQINLDQLDKQSF